MSNPVPLCAHVMASGITCGSPAVKGTNLCHHHSAIKTALGSVVPPDQIPYGIPFVFPEDRIGLQINYFLLLQAFNEGRMDLRTFNSLLRLVRAMDKNLGGKPLCEDAQAIADSQTPSEAVIPAEIGESLIDPEVVLNECAARVETPRLNLPKKAAASIRVESADTVRQHSLKHVASAAASASLPISVANTMQPVQTSTAYPQSFCASSSREKSRSEVASGNFTSEEIEARLAALKPQYFASNWRVQT